MTIKTITKKPIIATIAATILLGTVLIASNAFTNNVIAQAVDPSSPCPPSGEVQHWDKVIFQIKNDNNPEPNEKIKELIDKNTVLDTKVLDDPEEVADLAEVARAALLKKPIEISQTVADNIEIEIIDVLYETVTCGFTGPQGPPGPAGVSFTTHKQTLSVPAGNFASLIVPCPAGETATGGGAQINSGVSPIHISQPNPPDSDTTPTGWFGGGFNTGATVAPLFVWVICADTAADGG